MRDRQLWRRARWLLPAALVSTVIVQPAAVGDCPSPQLSIAGPRDAGGTVEVSGEFFFIGCNDTGVGCLPRPKDKPHQDLTIALAVFEGEELQRTQVDADDDYTFMTVLAIPDDVEPGTVLVVTATKVDGAEAAEPVRFILAE